MKNKLFRKHASVIPTGAPTLRSGQAARSGGIPSFRRFLVTLGMTALFCWSATAQNGVTVSNLDVKPGTVTFNVSWSRDNVPILWSDTVWVFVEYNNAGKMERLPLSNATLIAPSWSAASITLENGNDQGVWLIGNARSAGSFSTTVQLHTATADLSGVCAYASNYPPVGEYIDATHISFTGTSMYTMVLEETGGEGILTDYSDGLYTLRPGYTIQSFTDATGAPGIMKCMLPATYTLQSSASSFCAGSEGVQFALSGTEDGRHYQLYRDGVAVSDAVLDGTDNAATFTGSFDEAGTYTAQTIADEKYCAIAMNGTRVVIENPLPDNPTVNDNSRNCPGTVTLSASSSGAEIDWYADAAAASSFYTGASYTTPEIETSTTYYAQARNNNTGCLSPARVPVSATVNMEGCCTPVGTTAAFDEFKLCADAATGATWTLSDPRDSKTYKVMLMEDGHVWMVQDLKFGACSGTISWYNDNSAAATTHTPTVAPGYVGHCAVNSVNENGYYYSWPAAMNSQYAYAGSTHTFCVGTASGIASPAPGYCRGICPEGWHVPTSGSAGEFAQLSHDRPCNAQACFFSATWFYATSTGRIDSSGSLAWHPSEAHIWSSTLQNTLPLSFTLREHVVFLSDPFAANTGARVRCLMNY